MIIISLVHLNNSMECKTNPLLTFNKTMQIIIISILISLHKQASLFSNILWHKILVTKMAINNSYQDKSLKIYNNKPNNNRLYSSSMWYSKIMKAISIKILLRWWKIWMKIPSKHFCNNIRWSNNLESRKIIFYEREFNIK